MFIFGQKSGLLSTVAVVAALIAGASSAQNLRNSSGPAEAPPASFSSNQYIDSNGCVFVRAGIGGTTNWVPRVSRSREQLCGFQPSGAPASTIAQVQPEVPAPVPAPIIVAAPTPAPVVPTPTPAPVVQPPVVAEAPAPRGIRTATTLGAITPPIAEPATATPSPRVIAAPAVEPRTVTRAQACAGLTGIQSNFISQRTGQPIDCGGAPVQQVAAVEPPSPVDQAAPAVLSRLTRTQACEDASASGR